MRRLIGPAGLTYISRWRKPPAWSFNVLPVQPFVAGATKGCTGRRWPKPRKGRHHSGWRRLLVPPRWGSIVSLIRSGGLRHRLISTGPPSLLSVDEPA
jgi:hypothetical protein